MAGGKIGSVSDRRLVRRRGVEGPVLTDNDTSEEKSAGATASTADATPDGSAQSAEGAPPRHRRRRRRRRGPRPATVAQGTSLAEAATSSEPAEADPGVAVETAATRAPGENTLRLRTRPPRRRRRPPAIPEAGAPPAGEAEATGEASAPAGDAAPGQPRPPRLGPDGQPLRRRRRRRRPPQLGGAGDNAAGAEANADAAADPSVAAATDPNRRPPRHRNRRPRGGRPGERPAGEGGGTLAREGRPQRDRRPAGADPRDGDRRRDGQGGQRGDQREGGRREGGRGRRDGRDSRDGRGRGRGDGPKKIERKLYTYDSVVDRGFEDVEEDAGTRRVHWTIVKRTVADQISRKPMSHSYVLQRDGVDNEFPNLGAARNAVNKTIVHPEKLTLSKAEHAAQKSSR